MSLQNLILALRAIKISIEIVKLLKPNRVSGRSPDQGVVHCRREGGIYNTFPVLVFTYKNGERGLKFFEVPLGVNKINRIIR